MIHHRHNNDYQDSDFACWNRFIEICHANKVQTSNLVILEITLKYTNYTCLPFLRQVTSKQMIIVGAIMKSGLNILSP